MNKNCSSMYINVLTLSFGRFNSSNRLDDHCIISLKCYALRDFKESLYYSKFNNQCIR